MVVSSQNQVPSPKKLWEKHREVEVEEQQRVKLAATVPAKPYHTQGIDSLWKRVVLISKPSNRCPPKATWEMADSMDVSLSELHELVMGREAWRAAILGVAKCWT